MNMTMSAPVRRFMRTLHVLSSVGWFGALAVFLAHALVGATSQDPLLVRAACLAMGLSAWFVILPLSITSFLTGVVQALGTAWGLFRHYWVAIKLVLTTVATGVLLLKLVPISALAAAARTADVVEVGGANGRMAMVVHAVGGLLVLLVITGLSIYKPQGLTPYAARLQPERGRVAVSPMPRWVRVGGWTVLGFGVLMVGLLHAGHRAGTFGHG